MSKVDIIAHSRVRFPPFESTIKIAKYLPIVERNIVTYSNIEEEDLSIYQNQIRPPIKLGSEDSWLIQRELRIRKKDGTIEEWITNHFGMLDESEMPAIVKRQRDGWYLQPNPIHKIARKFIGVAVGLLLIGLFYQTIEPALVALDILSEPLAGGIQFGFLDYPFLVVFIGPLMLIPIIMRLGANLRDLLRQKQFLNNSPLKPFIEITETPTSDKPLKGYFKLPEIRSDWNTVQIGWHVGALPPAREVVLDALDRRDGRQPPPGYTTVLPHYWEAGLSDGTGDGEETPVQRIDAPGGLFLTPMRIYQPGSSCEIDAKGSEFSLDPPIGNWPGSEYGEMIRIHWEVVIRIDRAQHGPLFWIMPLRVKHGDQKFIVEDLKVNDGRIEDSPNWTLQRPGD